MLVGNCVVGQIILEHTSKGTQQKPQMVLYVTVRDRQFVANMLYWRDWVKPIYDSNLYDRRMCNQVFFFFLSVVIK